MTTISIFNGKERDKRYAILLWHDVETGRDTIARLDETDAATLRDALTAWLDAPRLAARFRCAEKDHPCGWEGTGAGVGVVEGDSTLCCPDCGGTLCCPDCGGDVVEEARGV